MADELSSEDMLAEVAKDQAASTEQTSTDQVTTQPQMHTYVTAGGKEISEPLEMVLKRAGMGYNYAQEKHRLDQLEAQRLEKYKGYDERIAKLSRWEEYDKYAAENPAWAKHVEDSWNSRSTNQQSTPGVSVDEIKSLKDQIAELRSFRDETLSVRTKEQHAREDSQFTEEIKTVSKNFGVDLDQADTEGRSLEWRVLGHMEKLGLDGSRPGHFTAAFKDYYFDHLQNRKVEQAKEGQTKEKAELKKAGILDISRTPKSAQPSKGYRPGMSWNELSDAALAEIRAAKA